MLIDTFLDSEFSGSAPVGCHTIFTDFFLSLGLPPSVSSFEVPTIFFLPFFSSSKKLGNLKFLGVVQLMSFQAIEFFSLFSLFLSGVMIVPHGIANDSNEVAKAAGRFNFPRDLSISEYRRVYFLLGTAQRVMKWYFQLPFKLYLTLLLMLTLSN